MRVEDALVQISDDTDCLRRKASPVVMRLYRSNIAYRKTILSIIEYMKDTMESLYEDYPTLKGISGANIGVPLNIVLVKIEDKNEPTVMINPEILKESTDRTMKLRSNCGSINLDEPIYVERYWRVVVKYFDRKGQEKEKEFLAGKGRPGGTVQHEIDHNLGILITDKEVKKSNEEEKE